MCKAINTSAFCLTKFVVIFTSCPISLKIRAHLKAVTLLPVLDKGGEGVTMQILIYKAQVRNPAKTSRLSGV